MELITGHARPRPVTDAAVIAQLIRRASDSRLSYSERAEAARGLAGVCDPSAVRALADAIVEPRRSKKAELMRIAIADTLKWRAAEGDRAAIAALHRAWFDRDTHIRPGMEIARALLASRGADEVLDFARGLVGPEARLPETASASSRSREATGLIWHWVYNTRRACHAGPGHTVDELRRNTTTRHAATLRRMSSRDMVHVFQREGASEVLGMWAGGPGGQVLIKAALSGLPNRSAEARRLIAEWVAEGGCSVFRGVFYARLDEKCVRLLWSVAPRLPEPTRGRTRALLELLCHGSTEDVVKGRRKLDDVVVEAVEAMNTCLPDDRWVAELGKGEWPQCFAEFLQHPAAKVALDSTRTLRERAMAADFLGFSAWIQLVELPVRFDDPLQHPALKVTLDKARAVRERNIAAELLRRALANGALEQPERAVPLIDEFFQEHVRSNDRYEFDFFRQMVMIRVRVTAPEKRIDVFFDLLDRRRAHLLDRAAALTYGAKSAYMWMDSDGPVRIAEEVVRCLDQTMKSGDTELPRVGSRLQLALSHLTPEKLPPQVIPYAGGPRWQDVWNDDVLAAWRAWLERFRKLPVFRISRKASAAN